MRITPTDAVHHIVNSLDSTNASSWYDSENDVSWHVAWTATGDDEAVISFNFVNDEDEYEEQLFRLVEVE